MDRRIVGLSLGLAMLVGCQGRPDIAYAEWLRQPRDPIVTGGRFEAFAKAAEMAEAAAPKYVDLVTFTPGKRDACLRQIGPALKALAEGGSRPELGYRFEVGKPFESPAHASGWRLLGRGLVWKIEQAVKARDLDAAVRCTVLANRFGFDLVGGGGAMEASLGMVIADESRRAIAPALGSMTADQLDHLADGIAGALASQPQLAQTIEHERLNMLAGVQALQDAYRAEEWGALVKAMGPDVRSAVDKLRQMRSDDPRDTVSFFKGMADEAESEARYAEQIADVPAAGRADVPEPKLEPGRPWRRFARHFFGTLRPLLIQHDETLARTRLLVMESRLQKIAKGSRVYPKDLSAWPNEITTDPFTGQPFAYRADGGDCKVYSVGRDLKDDGGQTDEAFSSPDLRLELR